MRPCPSLLSFQPLRDACHQHAVQETFRRLAGKRRVITCSDVAAFIRTIDK